MIQAMEDDINNRFGGMDNIDNIHLAVAHTQNEEAALELKKTVMDKFGVSHVDVYPLSLSVSCHIGPGSLAIACSKAIDI